MRRSHAQKTHTRKLQLAIQVRQLLQNFGVPASMGIIAGNRHATTMPAISPMSAVRAPRFIHDLMMAIARGRRYEPAHAAAPASMGPCAHTRTHTKSQAGRPMHQPETRGFIARTNRTPGIYPRIVPQ